MEVVKPSYRGQKSTSRILVFTVGHPPWTLGRFDNLPINLNRAEGVRRFGVRRQIALRGRRRRFRARLIVPIQSGVALRLPPYAIRFSANHWFKGSKHEFIVRGILSPGERAGLPRLSPALRDGGEGDRWQPCGTSSLRPGSWAQCANTFRAFTPPVPGYLDAIR